MIPIIDNQNILYEHQDFYVVAKPPNIPVHKDGFRSVSPPLLQQVRDLVGHHVWPIHRLDRQCSGVIVFSKTQQVVATLQESLQNGTKRYLALVRGRIMHNDLIEIETPIKVDKINNKYKDALTIAWSLQTQVQPPCSMVLVEPQTGRNHQVRRHLRDINHPIIHDGDHGDSRVNRLWRENHGITRLALHALSIEFLYQDHEYKIQCPLFIDHYTVYQNLDFWNLIQQQIPILKQSPIKINEKS